MKLNKQIVTSDKQYLTLKLKDNQGTAVMLMDQILESIVNLNQKI